MQVFKNYDQAIARGDEKYGQDQAWLHAKAQKNESWELTRLLATLRDHGHHEQIPGFPHGFFNMVLDDYAEENGFVCDYVPASEENGWQYSVNRKAV